MEVKLHIIVQITVISLYSVYIKYITEKMHEYAFKGLAQAWGSAVTWETKI